MVEIRASIYEGIQWGRSHTKTGAPIAMGYRGNPPDWAANGFPWVERYDNRAEATGGVLCGHNLKLTDGRAPVKSPTNINRRFRCSLP